MNNITKLLLSILLPQIAGGIGSIFTTSSIDSWYQYLAKPILNPPGWVFGPVWTILYILMGIAVFQIWKRGWNRKDVKIALGVFAIQLILNTFWSIIFFGLQSPGGAFIEIIFLWIAIVATIITFAKISKLAAWLLVPYVLWVTFAAYLNYSIYILN